MKNTIGENIKLLRKSLKLTQSEFAKKIGISRSYLGDLENDRRNISIETLKKISDKTGISSSYLIDNKPIQSDIAVLGENHPFRRVFDNNKEFNDILDQEITDIINDLKNVTSLFPDQRDIFDLGITLNLLSIKNDLEINPNKRKLAYYSIYSNMCMLDFLEEIDIIDKDYERIMAIYMETQSNIEKLMIEFL